MTSGGRSRVDAFEGDGDLEIEDVCGEVGFALFEVLADADDGREAVGEGGLELEVDGGVGLVEVLAALGVADEDVGGADGGEHGGRGLAGVGAFVEPVHGLRADEDGLVLRAASTSAGSEVIEGQRTISAAYVRLTRGKKLVRKAVDSAGVLYIFQLAAMRGLRMLC